ncbi:hypothetical protein [Rubellimicrobium mesophilum]|uniref:hypothetical protein n=1 Tax=Rubellimicrobium mesophilum TaxID=1123067 RepID=UPI0006EB9DD1|nr:hypothetical protein [Rubellimicrobium mesophilum]
MNAGKAPPFRRPASSARGVTRRLKRERLLCMCHAMTRVFDMGDRDRLPWRFFGAIHGIRAQL